jgi:hypothetical protein
MMDDLVTLASGFFQADPVEDHDPEPIARPISQIVRVLKARRIALVPGENAVDPIL